MGLGSGWIESVDHLKEKILNKYNSFLVRSKSWLGPPVIDSVRDFSAGEQIRASLSIFISLHTFNANSLRMCPDDLTRSFDRPLVVWRLESQRDFFSDEEGCTGFNKDATTACVYNKIAVSVILRDINNCHEASISGVFPSFSDLPGVQFISHLSALLTHFQTYAFFREVETSF